MRKVISDIRPPQKRKTPPRSQEKSSFQRRQDRITKSDILNQSNTSKKVVKTKDKKEVHMAKKPKKDFSTKGRMQPKVIQNKKNPKSFSSKGVPGNSRSKAFPRFVTVLLIVLAVIGGVSFLTHDATIVLYPQRHAFDLDLVLGASPEKTEDSLSYETVSIEVTKEKTVPFTGLEKVSEFAVGTIVVFNKGDSEQELSPETRFESPDGNIYRPTTNDPFVVPGGSTDQPGSLEIEVAAAIEGKEGEAELTDFTIPGWKEIGSPKFDLQYARSKTPIVLSGDTQVPIVETEILESTLEELRAQSLEEASKIANKDKPDSFILLPDPVATEFNHRIAYENDEAVLYVQAEYTYILISSDQFYKEVFRNLEAEENMPLYDLMVAQEYSQYEAFFAPQALALFGRGTVESERENTSISFRIKGDIVLLSEIETDSIANVVAGEKKDGFISLMNNFNEVRRAELSVTPFWLNRIPQDSKKLDITINAVLD